MEMVGSCDATPSLESSMGSLIRVVDTVGESEDHQDCIKRMPDLPAEILDIIFARVGFRNIMRSSITCKRWYSFVISKTACETPWLMLQDKSLDKRQFAVRFVSLWGEQNSQCRGLLDLRPRLPRFRLNCITSSADGWLLFGWRSLGNVLRPNSLWLHNPFRKACFQLPHYSPEHHSPSKASQNNPPQCLVFSSSQLSCDFVVGGKEEQLLCAIDNKSLVVDVFMLAECGVGEVGLVLVKSEQLRLDSMDRYTSTHFVESSGDVLIVVVDSWYELVVQVYKLSLSEGLKKIECLDGYALFVGVGCPAFSVPAKDWNSKVKEDCIYLATLSHVSVFSLKDEGSCNHQNYL